METENTDPWWEVRLLSPASRAEDIAALLIEEGALGAQDLDFDARGASPLDRHRLIAFFGSDSEPEAIAATTRALLAIGVDPEAAEIQAQPRPHRDWSESWKKNFRPLPLGERFIIVPSWEKSVPATDPSSRIPISMDPGMAFGTGHHETTALCVECLEKTVPELKPERLLDVGCGTGILSMVGVHLGARSILALDHDPIAVEACQDNATRNKQSESVSVTSTPLERIEEDFELIVANILATTLIEMAPILVKRLKPGGVLVLSGILTEQQDEVTTAYQNAFSAAGRAIRKVSTTTRGEWVAMTWRAS